MSKDTVLGEPGTLIEPSTIAVIVDADAATTFEQARWARSGVYVTRRGLLIRLADLGHEKTLIGLRMPPDVDELGGTCEVCGEPWPCPSRLVEVATLGGQA